MADVGPGKKKLDVVRAARALVDAHQIGDAKAAAAAGVSKRSVQIWRTQLGTNAELRIAYELRLEQRETAWTQERVEALRVVLARAVELAKTETDLDKLTRFVDKVGGVDVAGKVLSAVGSAGDRKRPPPGSGEDGADEADGEEAPLQ